MEESKVPRPFSFDEFETLISGIELLSTLGRKISAVVSQQPCEYLIQEATMAFVKMMKSVQAFLRFIPSRQFHAQEVEFAVDLFLSLSHSPSGYGRCYFVSVPC